MRDSSPPVRILNCLGLRADPPAGPGASLQSIADRLNGENFPPLTGRKWTRHTVKNVL